MSDNITIKDIQLIMEALGAFAELRHTNPSTSKGAFQSVALEVHDPRKDKMTLDEICEKIAEKHIKLGCGLVRRAIFMYDNKVNDDKPIHLPSIDYAKIDVMISTLHALTISN